VFRSMIDKQCILGTHENIKQWTILAVPCQSICAQTMYMYNIYTSTVYTTRIKYSSDDNCNIILYV